MVLYKSLVEHLIPESFILENLDSKSQKSRRRSQCFAVDLHPHLESHRASRSRPKLHSCDESLSLVSPEIKSESRAICRKYLKISKMPAKIWAKKCKNLENRKSLDIKILAIII